MRKFSIPCDFGGTKSPFEVYIGKPKDGNHPLQNQANWLSKERGGSIPPKVMESFAKLLDLAKKHNVSFEDLCAYALEVEGGAPAQGGPQAAAQAQGVAQAPPAQQPIPAPQPAVAQPQQAAPPAYPQTPPAPPAPKPPGSTS